MTAEVIETDRARMIRHRMRVKKDSKVSLAAVQGMADLLIRRGVITEAEFYKAVADRLEDV